MNPRQFSNCSVIMGPRITGLNTHFTKPICCVIIGGAKIAKIANLDPTRIMDICHVSSDLIKPANPKL